MTQAGRFDGRVAVVTGGGTPTGAAVVRALAVGGATVVAAGPEQAPLDDVVRLAPAGATIVPRTVDVADEDAVTGVIDGVAAEYGRLDVLVHAATGADPGTVAGLDTAAWRAATATLDGVVLASRAALPHLAAVGGSIAAVVPTAGGRARAAETATRGAVVGLVEAMALDHGPEGVRCNAVQIAPDDDAPPRGAARADDVAAVVAFLAGDAARAVTGALVRADGGPPATP